jgi:hypothetical protein
MLRIHHEDTKARRFDDAIERWAEQVADAAFRVTYLKLTDHSLGFLINFNVATLKEAIRRIVL